MTRRVAAAVALLVGHLVLAWCSIFLVAFAALYIGTCGSDGEYCGSADWSRWGAFLVAGGGGALLLANVIGSVWRLVKGRSATRFAAKLCGAQAVLTLFGVLVQTLAL